LHPGIELPPPHAGSRTTKYLHTFVFSPFTGNRPVQRLHLADRVPHLLARGDIIYLRLKIDLKINKNNKFDKI
jgi:hypothetical protein